MGKFAKLGILDWMLLFVPAALFLYFLAPERHSLIFFASCLAIIPLAGLLGRATEKLADRVGETAGGLLNATFGNAAELIIAVFALKEGLYDVVKASLTGSIIGNVLLVLGASFVAGGLRHSSQHFNVLGARSRSTLLIMAAVGLVVPAAFHALSPSSGAVDERILSVSISVILIVTYVLGLIFSLKTHRHYFASARETKCEQPDENIPSWNLKRSVAVLLCSTALVAWMSEILVGSIEPASHALGMSDIFVGVIVLAIIGNAAEHSTAILAALHNRMDLSVAISLGSSTQVALFVAPVIVFASFLIGPSPMNLTFTPSEVLAVVISVVVCGHVIEDGESNWLEGAQLLSVYAILALVFYVLPSA